MDANLKSKSIKNAIARAEVEARANKMAVFRVGWSAFAFVAKAKKSKSTRKRNARADQEPEVKVCANQRRGPEAEVASQSLNVGRRVNQSVRADLEADVPGQRKGTLRAMHVKSSLSTA